MRRSRFAPLKTSLWLAAGFILVREFWQLAFGSVSWHAAQTAVIGALPVALTVIAFGVLNSLVDVTRIALWCARIPFGRNVGLAFAIGLSTVAQSGQTAREVRAAQLMRGIRRPTTMLIPLLEHLVERAMGLGASLELRSFRTRNAFSARPGHIQCEQLTVRFGKKTVLENVSCDIPAGTITVLTGPTGSGKSTFLNAITGLAEHFSGATRTGRLQVAGIDRSQPISATARLIGYVPQEVRLGFVGNHAGDELAFTARLRGIGATRLDGREISQLSAGECVQLAIESATLHQPSILILDEPLANLDTTERARLIDELERRAAAGTTVLIAEHQTSELERLNPRWLTIESGALREGKYQPETPKRTRASARIDADPTVHAERLNYRYRGEPRSVRTPIEWTAGQVIAVTGPNGSGKTSVLRGLARPEAGTTRVNGSTVEHRRPNPRQIAFVPEDPRMLFVCETLAEELATADKFAHARAGLTELTLSSLLPHIDVPSIGAIHPRDLSTGTQRALAIAIQLSHAPAMLIIDEPTRGLDPRARQEMAEVFDCVAETGTVILFATHDSDWASLVADNEWTLHDGNLTHTGTPIRRHAAIRDGGEP
ncbi:MAG: ATP-binding cassette domain-containing protein [Agromyces sp.]